MRIHLDAGHGGTDPGAINTKRGLKEKDFTLRAAKGVGDILKANGVDVTYTRTTDVFLSLSARAALSNKNKADYFVSFHINAGGGVGFETFRHPNASAATKAFQDTVHKEIISGLKAYGVKDRGEKTGNLAVLRLSSAKAILIENLFIDSDDADILEKHYDEIIKLNASAILKAVGIKEKAAVTSPAPKAKTKVVVVTYEGSDGVAIRNVPDYDAKPIGSAKKGEAFTIKEEVNGFYKLKSGLFITNNPKYVTTKEV